MNTSEQKIIFKDSEIVFTRKNSKEFLATYNKIIESYNNEYFVFENEAFTTTQAKYMLQYLATEGFINKEDAPS